MTYKILLRYSANSKEVLYTFLSDTTTNSTGVVTSTKEWETDSVDVLKDKLEELAITNASQNVRFVADGDYTIFVDNITPVEPEPDPDPEG